MAKNVEEFLLSCTKKRVWYLYMCKHIQNCSTDTEFSIHVNSVPNTEYTEWQWPLSTVHFIMRVKTAQAGEGWECKPTSFPYIYYHIQICCVSSCWEGRYAPPISPLSLYVLCGSPPTSKMNAVQAERFSIAFSKRFKYKVTYSISTRRGIVKV